MVAERMLRPQYGLRDERCRARGKVFNLGLPRSGTTWFAELARNLGLRSLHCNDKEGCQGVPMRNLISAMQTLSLPASRTSIETRQQHTALLERVVGSFGSFSDHPWFMAPASVLKELAPSASFVLTVRDVTSWVRS